MAQTKKGSPYGLYKILVQKVGADGASYGQAGDEMANGTISPAFVIDAPDSFEVALPDRTILDFTGGDRWIGSAQMGITSLGSFPMSVATLDADLIALTTGTLVDITSNDEWAEFSEDILSDELPDVSVVAIYRIQSRELATWGQTFYNHLVVPRCKMAPKAMSGAPAFQAKGTYGFQITPTSNARHIHGPAFGAALGLNGNQAALYTVIADNPLMMVTMRASGITATIESPYQPVTETVGTPTSTKNLIVLKDSGVYTPGVADTIDDTAGDFAVGTALVPAAGEFLHLLFETRYEVITT